MVSSLALRAIAVDGFSASAGLDGQAIRLALDGTADVRAVNGLESLFEALHAEALRLKVHEVVVDLRQVEFMNSSCFKRLVSWLACIQDLPSERQYRIRILSDPLRHWQRRSLGALRCFAVDLVRVES